MRDKQIEEMAKVIKSSLDGLGSGNFNFTGEEISTMFAKTLYNAGYRKASDVAREIFKEIEKLMNKLDKRHIACGNPKQAWGVRSAMTELTELKKKYESEGEG